MEKSPRCNHALHIDLTENNSCKIKSIITMKLKTRLVSTVINQGSSNIARRNRLKLSHKSFLLQVRDRTTRCRMKSFQQNKMVLLPISFFPVYPRQIRGQTSRSRTSSKIWVTSRWHRRSRENLRLLPGETIRVTSLVSMAKSDRAASTNHRWLDPRRYQIGL